MGLCVTMNKSFNSLSPVGSFEMQTLFGVDNRLLVLSPQGRGPTADVTACKDLWCLDPERSWTLPSCNVQTLLRTPGPSNTKQLASPCAYRLSEVQKWAGAKERSLRK